MWLTRAERDLIYRRRRRRRRGVFLLIVVLALMAWAAAGHGLPAAHRRHRAGVPARRASHRAKPRKTRSNGTPRRPVLAARPDLTWASYHGIGLPASRADGPRHTSKGLAWGFADSPDGALLAAVNIAVRTAAQWGPAVYVPTIRGQVTGPGTAALLRADAGGYAALRAAAGVRRGRPAGAVHTVVAAYRFVAWAPADATVDVVTEAPGAGGQVVATATRIEVLWLRGDWRVLAPPGGDWSAAATALPSLSGYTPFPNQR